MIRAFALPLLAICIAEALLLVVAVAWERGWPAPSTNCAVDLKGH
jgi:hypothetical protein